MMRHLLKDRTAQRDFLWRNPAAAEFVEDLPAVQESEDIIRTFVAQTFPAVGIDMVHHQAYMCLAIDGDIFSFRQKKGQLKAIKKMLSLLSWVSYI